MKASELRELSRGGARRSGSADEEENLANLRFQLATSQLESPIKVRLVPARHRDASRPAPGTRNCSSATLSGNDCGENVMSDDPARHPQRRKVRDRQSGQQQDGEEHRRRHRAAGAAPDLPEVLQADHDAAWPTTKSARPGVGDMVRIMETRPLSKHKRWRLVTIVEKAK